MLAEILGIENYAAVGLVMCLSTWAADYAQDGILSAFPPRAIAEAVGWRKSPQKLIDALIDSGYVDRNDEELSLHDFQDYAGKLHEKRESEKTRLKNYRVQVKNGDRTDNVHVRNEYDTPPVQKTSDVIEEKRIETLTDRDTLLRAREEASKIIGVFPAFPTGIAQDIHNDALAYVKQVKENLRKQLDEKVDAAR
jgi:hypothetical protein